MLTMKIAVASENPVKINAVKKAFSKFFTDFEIISSKVKSGVSEQPLNWETVKGATNRVLRLKEIIPGCDFYIGIEGGVMSYSDKGLAFGAIVISDSMSNTHIGFSPFFELPKSVSDRIFDGEELGPVIDSISHETDTKKKSGAVGLFSDGITNRTEFYVSGVVMAILPFVNKYYQEKKTISKT